MIRTKLTDVAAVFLLAASVTARAFGMPTVAAEPTLAQRLAKLTEVLEEQRQELHIPGMAVAVVQGDELVYSRGFGHADLEKGTPVTPETLFAIGSSTKAFTASLIGMLVDEGKMSWDDPVTKLLPEFKLRIDADDPRAIVTIRDLLAHRTGFTRMGLLWASGAVSREEMLRTATRAEPWSGFREKFYYNNVTYTAAGVASGVAAGSSWEALLAKRIFTPLGMNHSSSSIRALADDARVSRGYRWNDVTHDHELLPMRLMDAIAPAGAINSNVLDMAQWLRFQLGHGTHGGQALLSATAHGETWRKQIEIGGGVDYGLGWMMREVAGRRVVEHGGNIDGFSAQVALFPDADMGFVLLTNVTATPLQSVSINLIAAALLADWSEEGTQARAAENLGDYAGRYEANFATFKQAFFTVSVKADRLAVDVPGEMTYELHPPNADGRWVFRPIDQLAISFDLADDGDVTSMKLYRGGVLRAELPRIEGTEPVALPSVEEILALRQPVADTGVGSVRITGSVRFVHAGVEGRATHISDGRGRHRLDLDFGRFGWIHQAMSKEQGWMDSNIQPFQRLEGKYLAQAMVAPTLVLPVDWSRVFDTVTVAGTGTLDGRKVYELHLRAGELPAITASIDAETGDLLRYEMTMSDLKTGIDIQVVLRNEDFREVEGLRVAFRSVSRNKFSGEVVFEIEKLETKVVIDESLFSAPKAGDLGGADDAAELVGGGADGVELEPTRHHGVMLDH